MTTFIRILFNALVGTVLFVVGMQIPPSLHLPVACFGIGLLPAMFSISWQMGNRPIHKGLGRLFLLITLICFVMDWLPENYRYLLTFGVVLVPRKWIFKCLHRDWRPKDPAPISGD